MCGLIGYSGKESANIYKILHLFADNDSRGGHSVGVYMNGKLFKSTDQKGSGTSPDLYPIFIKENVNDFGKLIIGHTRYATHGQHTVDNAHPFQYNEIIGAHNGVLSNYEEVGKKFGIKKTTVDSQMIFKVLAHNTNKMGRLGMFSGTLNTLFTKSDGKLYVFKHNNPLFALKTKEGIYLSSLEDGLKDIKEKGDTLYGVKSDVLYTLQDGETINKQSIKRNEVASTVKVNTNWRSYGSTTVSDFSYYDNALDTNQQSFNFGYDDDFHDEYDVLSQELTVHEDFVNNLYQESWRSDKLGITEEEAEKLYELREFLASLHNKIIELC